MDKVFLFCAILGSLLIVFQFLTTLFGLGGDDLADDASGGADGGSCDAGGDSGDVGTSDASGDGGSDAAGSRDGGFAFLKAFSLRTLTAGVAFFGLAGLAGQAANWPEIRTLIVAIVVGAAAFASVFYLMRGLTSLRADGSIKPSTATGCEGSVYLRIPAKRGGFGKVVVVQQERSMEYEAATDEDVDLATGTPIVVVKHLSPSQMLVAKRRD